jgi:hypothetical protein
VWRLSEEPQTVLVQPGFELLLKKRDKMVVSWFQTARFGPILVVFLAAATVRVGWHAPALATHPEFSSTQPFRAHEMGEIATNIAEGRGFSSPFDRGAQPTAWECPIVPFLFAGFIKLAGGATGQANRLIILSQAIVSAFAAAIYWLTARRLTIRHAGLFSAWLSPVLAVVICLWPEAISSVANPWYFVWQEAALAVFVLLAMRWWDQLDFERGILVGIAGGVLALINVTPLPIIAFAILFPALKGRFQWWMLRSIAVPAGVFAIVAAPWLARDAVVFQTFVPFRSNTGYEIFQGNNEVECIRLSDNPRHPWFHGEEYERYVLLGEIRYSHEALGRAVEYARDHPGETVRRTAARIYVSWLTDLTDHWAKKSEQKWWLRRPRFVAGRLTSVLLTIASLGVIVQAIWSGKFRRLPYAPLFAAVVFFLPVVNYVTVAEAEYTAVLRMWLGVLAVLLLALRAPQNEPGEHAEGGFGSKGNRNVLDFLGSQPPADQEEAAPSSRRPAPRSSAQSSSRSFSNSAGSTSYSSSIAAIAC